jgi:hypothetical protein
MNKETAADYFAYRKAYRFEEAFSAIKAEEGSLKIPLGVDESGAFHELDLAQAHSLLLLGDVCYGKTNYLAIVLASLLRQKEGGDAIVLHTAFGDGSGWRKTLGDNYTNGLGKRERSGFIALRKEAEKDAERIALSGSPSRETYNLAHPESAVPRRIVLIDDLDDFLREEASLEGEILSLKGALDKSGGCLIATMEQSDERIEEAFETILRFHLEKGYGEIGEEEPGPGKAWLFEGGRRSTPLLQLPYIGKKELIAESKRARTKEIGDISGPFIETLFRVSCLEGGYVPGVVVKRDLFDCIDLKNAQEKEDALYFWKKLAQDLGIQIQGSFDDDFGKIRFKKLSEEEYLKDLATVGDKSKAEPLTPLERKVYAALEDKFGNDWSSYLMTNVWREVKTIQIYFLEGLFLQTLSEAEELEREGVPYFIPNSGLVGWLLGMGSLNPLLHYARCPKCRYSHGVLDYGDLDPDDQKEDVCPRCGSPLIKEGEHVAPAFFRKDLSDDGGVFSLRLYVPKGYLKRRGIKEDKPGEAMAHVEPEGFIHYVERREFNKAEKGSAPLPFDTPEFHSIFFHYHPKDRYEVAQAMGLYLSGIDRILGRCPDLRKTPLFREDAAAMLIGSGVDVKEAHPVGFDVARGGVYDLDAIERVRALVAKYPKLEEGWGRFAEILPLMRKKSEAIFEARMLERAHFSKY